MSQRIILTALSVTLCGSAIAAETSMTCENPHRAYIAHVDRVAKTFWIEVADGITHYQVREIVNADGGFIVHGTTVAEGPDFTAYISNEPHIDFHVGGKITQADKCE